MTFDAGVQDVIQVVSIVATPALAATAYFLKRISDQLAQVRSEVEGVKDEFRKMNGKVIRLEEWKSSHDRQDDERNERMHEDMIELRRAVESVPGSRRGGA